MAEERITPAQMRAGRALLGWTQNQLAEASRLGLSTIKDVEVGKRNPTVSNLLVIRRTLEDGGVIFIPADDDGPGVRLRGNPPEMVRRPFHIRADETMAFLVRSRERTIMVQIPKAVIDELDQSHNATIQEYMAAFRRNESRILKATGEALKSGRFDENGFIQLTGEDF